MSFLELLKIEFADKISNLQRYIPKTLMGSIYIFLTAFPLNSILFQSAAGPSICHNAEACSCHERAAGHNGDKSRCYRKLWINIAGHAFVYSGVK